MTKVKKGANERNKLEVGKRTDDTDSADSRKLKPKPILTTNPRKAGREGQQVPLKVEDQLELKVEMMARMNLNISDFLPVTTR